MKKLLISLGTCVIAAALTLLALLWLPENRGRHPGGGRDLDGRLQPRPFALRLTGDLPYASCGREPAAEDDLPSLICKPDGPRRKITFRLPTRSREPSASSSGHGEASSLHHQARHQLLGGVSDLRLGQVVQLLGKASSLDPCNGAILSDLAVALAVEANQTGTTRGLVEALEVAEEAVECGPELPEALWNQAMLRGLFLRHPAMEAWKALLAVERDAEWRAEAEQHLKELRGPSKAEQWASLVSNGLTSSLGNSEVLEGLARDFDAELRLHLVRQLIPTWAKAAAAGQTQASELKAAVLALGRALEKVTGDVFPLEVALELDAAIAGARSQAQLAQLADGWAALARAERLFDGHLYTEARSGFEDAERAFKATSSLASFWSRHWAACSSQRLFVLNPSIQAVLRDRFTLPTESQASPGTLECHESREFPQLLFPQAQGKAPLIGTFQTQRDGRLAVATGTDLRCTSFVRALLPAIGRRKSVESWRRERGSPEDYFGSTWFPRREILRRLFFRESDSDYLTLVSAASDSARRQGDLRAALVFQLEELRVSKTAGSNLRMQVTQRKLGRLLASLERQVQAHEAFAAAESTANRLPDPEAKVQALDFISLEQCEALPGVDAKRLQAILEGAVGRFLRLGLTDEAIRSLHARALILGGEGDLSAATLLLRKAAHLIENQAEKATNPSGRAQEVGKYSSTYDSLAACELKQGRPSEALLLTEKAKSSGLLLALSEASWRVRRRPQPRNLAEIIQQLPHGAAFVVYHLSPFHAYVWVLRGGSEVTTPVELDGFELSKLLPQLAATTPGEEDETLLSALYETLWRPVQRVLRPEEPVHVVLDTELEYVPWGRLVNRETKRELIDERALAFVPSLRGAAALAAFRSRPLPTKPRVLALVAPNLEFSYPEFSSLAGATEEGQSIDGGVADARVFLGDEATRQTLIRELPDHDVLVLSTHSLAAGTYGLNSIFWLAPTGLNPEFFGPDPPSMDFGQVSSKELQALPVDHLSLVIAAGCETAGFESTEGPTGLVWNLMGRGVPRLIAAKGNLDDAGASQVIPPLLEAIVAGVEPAEALRQQQLAARNSKDRAVLRAAVALRYYGLVEPGRKPPKRQAVAVGGSGPTTCQETASVRLSM